MHTNDRVEAVETVVTCARPLLSRETVVWDKMKTLQISFDRGCFLWENWANFKNLKERKKTTKMGISLITLIETGKIYDQW